MILVNGRGTNVLGGGAAVVGVGVVGGAGVGTVEGGGGGGLEGTVVVAGSDEHAPTTSASARSVQRGRT